MPYKQINPNKPDNRIHRFLVGAVGACVLFGLLMVGIFFIFFESDVSHSEHQGLIVQRSGPTAFWVAPAQKSTLKPALREGLLHMPGFRSYAMI